MTASPSCDLSVIIVNWNTREFLRRCLDSVLDSSKSGDPKAVARPLSLEVWVIDNASLDGSAALVREEYPQVHLIANSHNRGYAAANNQALALARGEYALLLNADTELPPGTLLKLVRFLREHPRAGAVGPRLVLQRGQIQGGAAGYEPSPWTVFNYCFFLYKLAPRLFRGLWLAKRQYRGKEPIRVDWVSGAALMVRMGAARQAGPLDEGYFMYVEDVEWCQRLRCAAWEVYCLPEAHVIHHIGRSTRQLGPGFHATSVHSLDRYYRARYPPATVRLLHLFGAGGSLTRSLAYAVLYATRRKLVYAELRDQWRACAQAGMAHLLAETRPSAENAERGLP